MELQKDPLASCGAGEKQGVGKSSKPQHLPEELIYAILSKLPTKSVIRFICMNKTWNSFIQEPYFLKLRQNMVNPTKPLYLFVCPRIDKATKWQPNIFMGHVPTNEDQRPLELNNSTHIFSMPESCPFDVQSVNGLLCTFPRLNYDSHVDVTHICNPTTRQVVTLPRDTNIDLYPKFKLLTQFGYDTLGDKFKVLRIILNEDKLIQELKILTVGDYVWRNVACDIPYDLMSNIVQHRLRYRGTYVNGAIHWLNITHKVILVFDLRIEQFREIPIFELNDDFNQTLHMLFSGHLSLVKYDVDMEIMDLSILKDYENHVWINERILITESSHFKYGGLYPFGKIHTQEIMLLPGRVKVNEVRVCYYNSKKRSSREILAVEIPSYFDDEFQLLAIVDSNWLITYQENFKWL